MAGAFLVLVLGMGLSVITALVEFFWVSRSALANENVGQFFRRIKKVKYVENVWLTVAPISRQTR